MRDVGVGRGVSEEKRSRQGETSGETMKGDYPNVRSLGNRPCTPKPDWQTGA